jgi:glycosyltransferase involved in cell wall biosynthesis
MSQLFTMPHIVHISAGKDFRGGERQTLWLHEGLLRAGRKSTLLLNSRGVLYKRNPPGCVSFRWGGVSGFWGLASCVRAIGRLRPDIIHCHDAHALTIGALAGVVCKVPVVTARRVVKPIGGGWFSLWKYRQCCRIIAVSSAVEEVCRGFADVDTIAVVHDGVDSAAPVLDKTEARRGLGVPADCFIAGTVGHFTPEKNIALLSALAQRLSGSYPKARLLCIGPMADAVQKELTAYPAVIACGEREDAVRFYSAIDCYVSASRHEGLGTALLDALVHDIPSVATDAKGTRDLYPAGYPLVPPDDFPLFIEKVESVMRGYPAAVNNALAIGARARGLFSVETMVRKTIGLYDEIIGNASNK